MKSKRKIFHSLLYAISAIQISWFMKFDALRSRSRERNEVGQEGSCGLMKILCLCLFLVFAGSATANLAQSINSAALQAFQDSNLVVRDNKVILYGMQTNGADTKGGKYGCAKVVSITLRQAGVNTPILLGVSGIETKLKHWKRIGDRDSVRAGDVVVWISRFKGNTNGACTGGGTCHVGIMTEKGAFHNNPLGNRPILNGIGLKFGYRFKAAYRPPPDARTAAAGQVVESASH